ncbi:MAG: CdvA-like protein [Candidatus Bathyarchaeota archaeon]|nr:CdvA-like protein [Candidatus Bathyarchaeota archaeon]
MSSWKRSLEAITQELELVKKKKQTLDELLAKKRMSQPTYGHLVKRLPENIVELEDRQRLLASSMTGRADELEKQTAFLELVLTNLEIRHIADEIDGETYASHKEAITLGLDATKAELAEIRNSLAQIVPASAELSETE